MKDRIIVSVKPAGHCEPIGREILRSNGSRTCIVRLGHVATMNGFVQALYEMHRFATKFDRPMPQKPLFHGHNLNWSGRRESNRRMQLGSCSCLMNSGQGHSRRVRGVHIRSSLRGRIRPERWVTFLAFPLMRKLRRGFRRLAYTRRLAEVAAEAAELDEPEVVATLPSLSKPSSFMRCRGPANSQSRSRHRCRN
jgi:hypothetical protein